MAPTKWPIALLAAVVLVSVSAALSDSTTMRQPKSRARRSIFFPLTIILTLALVSCGRAPSEKTVRNLAGSPDAARARQQAEEQIRYNIAYWESHTPLTLGLIALEDACGGGKETEWFFPTGDDQYKIRCTVYAAAYFGADPTNVADTIDGILAAGDLESSPVPFGHDFIYARSVVDYYRGKIGDPQGPGTGEPSQLFSAGTVRLEWDQVRQSGTRKLIAEPRPCSPSDPPLRRCLREPATTSVADLRRQHGMVFKLTFSATNYFVVRK
ncbi:hypothetical protein [Streptomyces sp. bgisy153]|uniref:hypothetical protein n=1 Tax=Streptomyces sp. bgisy153 TaxID=3413793 RepID=UPI003D7421BA